MAAMRALALDHSDAHSSAAVSTRDASPLETKACGGGGFGKSKSLLREYTHTRFVAKKEKETFERPRGIRVRPRGPRCRARRRRWPPTALCARHSRSVARPRPSRGAARPRASRAPAQSFSLKEGGGGGGRSARLLQRDWDNSSARRRHAACTGSSFCAAAAMTCLERESFPSSLEVYSERNRERARESSLRAEKQRERSARGARVIFLENRARGSGNFGPALAACAVLSALNFRKASALSDARRIERERSTAAVLRTTFPSRHHKSRIATVWKLLSRLSRDTTSVTQKRDTRESRYCRWGRPALVRKGLVKGRVGSLSSLVVFECDDRRWCSQGRPRPAGKSASDAGAGSSRSMAARTTCDVQCRSFPSRSRLGTRTSLEFPVSDLDDGAFTRTRVSGHRGFFSSVFTFESPKPEIVSTTLKNQRNSTSRACRLALRSACMPPSLHRSRAKSKDSTKYSISSKATAAASSVTSPDLENPTERDHPAALLHTRRFEKSTPGRESLPWTGKRRHTHTGPPRPFCSFHSESFCSSSCERARRVFGHAPRGARNARARVFAQSLPCRASKGNYKWRGAVCVCVCFFLEGVRRAVSRGRPCVPS